MSVRAIIAPGIIFAAGSMAGAANAATTIDTNFTPVVGGNPITLLGGVGSSGSAQFQFNDQSITSTPTGQGSVTVSKFQIAASVDDPTAGIFYQGNSVTLAAPTNPDYTTRSIYTRKPELGAGDGNYALRFTGDGTLYTGFATVTNGGGLIDSITYEAAGAVPAVPEPATWALMILGLGIVGADMRRRRRQGRAVALAA